MMFTNLITRYFRRGIADAINDDQSVEDHHITALIADVNYRAVVTATSYIAARMVRPELRQNLRNRFLGCYRAGTQAPGYCGAKSGLAAFARSLDTSVRRGGVSITLFHPGFVDTPMQRRFSYWRPFMVTADATAAAIMKSVDRKHRVAIHPWQHAFGVRILALLPTTFVGYLLNLVPLT